IQESAKVITESIDKDAKVIFGAIKDDKLKKGEIKVTVIATGFPEEGEIRPAAVSVSSIRREEPLRVEKPSVHQPIEIPAPKEDSKRGRIYNTLGFGMDHDDEDEPKEKETPITSAKQQHQPEPEIVDDDEEDNEWGVPAFLRRSKLK
ncbi:MAG: hypothetical protein WCT49_06555, partial [Candidatus Paceibacterota bacterium]